MTTESITNLPRITVQHDISAVIADVRDGTVNEEDVWVSCYQEGKPSVHGKVQVSKSSSTGVTFSSRDGISWNGTTTAEFRVSCSSLSIPEKPIRLPKHVYTFQNPQKVQRITAFDISPDGKLLATGYADGSIVIASLSSPELKRRGTPHLSTILSLHFFPSSTVLLSTSSDLSIRIHEATPSTDAGVHPINTARTHQGHTAGVTASAIIDRGRNILSFGRDGTARLWDVGGGKEIVPRRWRAPRGNPILCGVVGEPWYTNTNPDSPTTPAPGDVSTTTLDGEIGTDHKLVFVGLQNGSVRGYQLSTGHPRFFSSGVDPSLTNSKVAPLDSIAYDSQRGVLAAGKRDGVVMFWNLNDDSGKGAAPRAPGAGGALEDEYDWRPVTFKRSGASVESLAFAPPRADETLAILIGTEDGLFCRVAIGADGKPVLVEEYVGVQAGDAVRAVKSSTMDGVESVWSASDDGCVRRY